MMLAAFVVAARCTLVCHTTGLALACGIVGDCSVWIIVFVLWGCRRGGWLWSLGCGSSTGCYWLGGRCGGCECGSIGGSGLWFLDGCIVDGAVFAGCAGRNGHEFVKSQDAGLATFPSCRVMSIACSYGCMSRENVPFWPSWNSGYNRVSYA
jgi:hypothetical protein